MKPSHLAASGFPDYIQGSIQTPDNTNITCSAGGGSLLDYFVVSDALYISRSLGRALVEPLVANSRLGESRPALRRSAPSPNQTGATTAASADPRVESDRAFAGLSLRHYWDLQPLCDQFDVVPRALRDRGCDVGADIAPLRPHLLEDRAYLLVEEVVKDAVGREQDDVAW